MTRTSHRSEDVVLSPAAARRRLGAELRALRERADLTLDAPAARLQRSTATVSRLETGKAAPRNVDVRELLELYRETIPDAVTPETVDRLLALADDSRRQGWLSSFGDVLSGDMTPENVRYFVNLESSASEIWSFEPELVPGLLQTRAYAESVTRMFFPTSAAAERERFVAFRLARQEILRRDVAPLHLRLVLGEGVFRKPFGGAAVMREQLATLRSSVRGDLFPHVDLRIAPDALLLPGAIGGPFLVMLFTDDSDQNLIYLEGRRGELYLEKGSEVMSYQELFDELAATSLADDAAVAFLDSVIDSFD